MYVILGLSEKWFGQLLIQMTVFDADLEKAKHVLKNMFYTVSTQEV